MGFIDPSLLETDDTDNVTCSICMQLLDTPMSPGGCQEGHTFCASCLRDALKATPRCPTCRAASSPDALTRLIEDLKPNLGELVDLNEVIVEKLTGDKRMLVGMFRNAAASEFRFIQRSGLYFGLPLGIPVMFIWYFFQAWWLLPAFGLLVGYITNALAIYLIQKPLEPVKIGPFTVQGLFIKRQKEVSRYYGKVMASDLVTAEIVVGEMLKINESVDRLRELIHREVNRALRPQWPPPRRAISGTMTAPSIC